MIQDVSNQLESSTPNSCFFIDIDRGVISDDACPQPRHGCRSQELRGQYPATTQGAENTIATDGFLRFTHGPPQIHGLTPRRNSGGISGGFHRHALRRSRDGRVETDLGRLQGIQLQLAQQAPGPWPRSRRQACRRGIGADGILRCEVVPEFLQQPQGPWPPKARNGCIERHVADLKAPRQECRQQGFSALPVVAHRQQTNRTVGVSQMEAPWVTHGFGQCFLDDPPIRHFHTMAFHIS